MNGGGGRRDTIGAMMRVQDPVHLSNTFVDLASLARSLLLLLSENLQWEIVNGKYFAFRFYV